MTAPRGCAWYAGPMDDYETDAQKTPEQLSAEVDAFEANWAREEHEARETPKRYARGAVLTFGLSIVCAAIWWFGGRVGLPGIITTGAALVGFVSFVVAVRTAIRAGIEGVINLGR